MTHSHELSVELKYFNKDSLDRGRSRFVEILWWIFKLTFIQSSWPWPSPLKVHILRAFGANIGEGAYLRPGITLHFPWKLTLGDNVWIGERCTLLNLAPIVIGNNTALAHDVYLAAAGHDIRSPTFAYDNRPIVIHAGVWVGTRAYVGPGVTIREHAVVAAGSVVPRDVEAWTVVAGVPAKEVSKRVIRWESA